MLRVVIDTNIFISAIISPDKTCAELIKLWATGNFALFLSSNILAEIEKVLRYPKISKIHRYTEEETQEFINYLKDFALFTPGKISLDVVKDDPKDNIFVSCAVEAGANFLISGDSDLLKLGHYKNISIITAKEFLGLLN